MGKRKWYVVTRGLGVGVFETWLQVSPLVTGVSGALHQSFPTEEEAYRMFDEEQSRGNVKIIPAHRLTRPQSSAAPQSNLTPPEPPHPSPPQQNFARSPPPPRRFARDTGHSQPTLNTPTKVAVKSEVVASSPSLSPSSSPPTGVTQCGAYSSADLSSFPSPRFVAASCPSAARTIQINITLPPHCGCGHPASESDGTEILNSLSRSLQMAGLGGDPHISRVADPRSPFTQHGLSSRRPSPRMPGPSVLFQT
ncbi:hypothetical protein C8R46DRAFT_1054008 [Mycena filopes]|nr:hypothetical protein C8R46DRAFT_1054008 [Mycena filopes]